MERALIFFIIFFPRLERALVLLCYIFRAWNINFLIPIFIFFSLVAIIVQVLIFLKMIDVEVIHGPIWDIRIVVFLL